MFGGVPYIITVSSTGALSLYGEIENNKIEFSIYLVWKHFIFKPNIIQKRVFTQKAAKCFCVLTF
jgi:hypothetical protein